MSRQNRAKFILQQRRLCETLPTVRTSLFLSKPFQELLYDTITTVLKCLFSDLTVTTLNDYIP